MKRHSIVNRVLSVVSCAFIAASCAVFILAHLQLREIVNFSQHAVFEEKLSTIIRTLDRTLVRVEATENRVAYENFFQDSVLKALRQSYYTLDQQSYPFIIDDKGIVVMHPILPRANKSLQNTSHFQKILQIQNGELNFSYAGEKYWTIFMEFPDWHWIVGFVMTQDVKYADVNIFRNRMIIILAFITLFVILAIAIIINKMIHPIISLTVASKAMEDGDLEQEIDTGGKDELGALAKSFSNMRNTIREKISDQHNSMNRAKKQQEAIVKIATSKLLLSRNKSPIIQLITETSTMALNVSRGSIWLFDDDHTNLRRIAIYKKNIGYNSHETKLLVSDYPHYFAALDEGLPIIADDAKSDPQTCEFTESYLTPNQVTSRLDTVIHIASRSVGIVCFEQVVKVKIWKPDEVAFARNIAEQMALILVNFQLSKTVENLHETESRSQAKSTFLANMSHELRTPLNVILGFSLLMQHDPLLSSQHKKDLNTINRSGEHLLALINDVLEISKIEARKIKLRPTTFDLHALLNDLVTMFRIPTKSKNLQLNLNIHPEVPCYIFADEGKLRQILINILDNSVKFTEKGGIVLRAMVKKEDPQEIHLVILVEDTGVGIAEGELHQLFQSFEQTTSGQESKTGTGLGLAISREYARLMGGDITVNSQVRKGSTFLVKIRIQKGKTENVPENLRQHNIVGLAPNQNLPKILVVEDKEENRQLLVRLLTNVGFKALEACNGQEAVDIWKMRLAKGRPPQLIWMDMRMPVMDGLEATRQIKSTEKGKETVIIALTASAFDEDRVKFLQVGCDDFVRKPYREIEIFDKIAKYFGIEYQYESQKEVPSPDPQEKLKPEDFLGLSKEWLVEMQRALIISQPEKIRAMLEQLEPEHLQLFQKLHRFSQNFQYRVILESLEAHINSIEEKPNK